MKVAIALAAVCAVFAVIFAEPCRRPDDCSLEICAANVSHIACHFGECTCDPDQQNGQTCSSANDCTNTIRCRDRFQHLHCVDGSCRCLNDRPIIG